MKNLSLFLIIAILILVGIGYSVLSSPDYPKQKMFSEALKGFADKAGHLQNEYLNRQNLTEQKQLISVDFQLLLRERVNQTVTMEVSSQHVTLRISDKNRLLAGQTVVLEPFLDNGIVRWKCINGSVLARVRSKNCRTGVGETLESMRQL